MTTTVRRRIPRLICASYISSALLISGDAATAIAAQQSPAEASVQKIPRDDNPNPNDDSGGHDNGGHDQTGDLVLRP